MKIDVVQHWLLTPQLPTGRDLTCSVQNTVVEGIVRSMWCGVDGVAM